MKNIIMIIIIGLSLIMTPGCLDSQKKSTDKEYQSFLFAEKIISFYNITGFAKGNEITLTYQNITDLNITKIEFFMTHNNTEKYKDLFLLEIEAPIDQVFFNPTNKTEYVEGDIILSCNVQDIPNNLSINNKDYISTINKYTTMIGQGKWEFKIQCKPIAVPWEEEWLFGDHYKISIRIFGYYIVLDDYAE